MNTQEQISKLLILAQGIFSEDDLNRVSIFDDLQLKLLYLVKQYVLKTLTPPLEEDGLPFIMDTRFLLNALYTLSEGELPLNTITASINDLPNNPRIPHDFVHPLSHLAAQAVYLNRREPCVQQNWIKIADPSREVVFRHQDVYRMEYDNLMHNIVCKKKARSRKSNFTYVAVLGFIVSAVSAITIGLLYIVPHIVVSLKTSSRQVSSTADSVNMLLGIASFLASMVSGIKFFGYLIYALDYLKLEEQNIALLSRSSLLLHRQNQASDLLPRVDFLQKKRRPLTEGRGRRFFATTEETPDLELGVSHRPLLTV